MTLTGCQIYYERIIWIVDNLVCEPKKLTKHLLDELIISLRVPLRSANLSGHGRVWLLGLQTNAVLSLWSNPTWTPNDAHVPLEKGGASV